MLNSNYINKHRYFQRIWAISDIHVDYKANQKWIQALKTISHYNFSEDILLVAGDISADFFQLKKTLEILVSIFGIVFFVPGNHDLWLHQNDSYLNVTQNIIVYDSLQKCKDIVNLCCTIGVFTKPQILFMVNPNEKQTYIPVSIIPMLSWHHISWDIEPDIIPQIQGPEFQSFQLPPLERFVVDYVRTKWPYSKNTNSNDDDVYYDENQKIHHHYGIASSDTIALSYNAAKLMDDLNDTLLKHKEFIHIMRSYASEMFQNEEFDNNNHYIISLSHFVPDIRLIPPKRDLLYPTLSKASGSILLKNRIKKFKSNLHIFGHTHFGWDMMLEHTRYLQAALSYPHERNVRPRSITIGGLFQNLPLLLWENGSFVSQYDAHFSNQFQDISRRNPSNTKISTWVRDVWKRFL